MQEVQYTSSALAHIYFRIQELQNIVPCVESTSVSLQAGCPQLVSARPSKLPRNPITGLLGLQFYQTWYSKCLFCKTPCWALGMDAALIGELRR